MPRKSTTPPTRLGQAIQARRGAATGYEAAAESGLSPAMLYAIEQDRRRPGAQAARALAAWLGPPWTTDDVLDAARQPPSELAQNQDTAAPSPVVAAAVVSEAATPAPVVGSPPVPMATTPAPVSTVAQALRLPDGHILRPWRVGHIDGKPAYERVQLGGLASIRANLKQVAADDVPQPQQAIVRNATSLEHLREVVDRWLITNGATVIDA